LVRKGNRTLLTVGLALVVIGSVFGFAFLLGGDNAVLGNVSRLQVTENFQDFNCDAWNELSTNTNGQFTVVGSGRQGFNPSFDTSLLSVTDGTSEVDGIRVSLILECQGNFIEDSLATTVEGSMDFQLCADPIGSTTVCFQGSDREFKSLEGSAVGVETFLNVPIAQTEITDDQRVSIYDGDISAFEIESVFGTGDGKIHFKTTMFPNLIWTFNQPTIPPFTASYNAITENDPIISQYGELRVTDTDPDTDGDGFIDSEDGCINDPENFNGFEDGDGCSDVFVTTAMLCSETESGVDDLTQRNICIQECQSLGGEWTSIIGRQSSSFDRLWNNGICIATEQTMMEMIEEMLQPQEDVQGEDADLQELVSEPIATVIPPPLFELEQPQVSEPSVRTTVVGVPEDVEESSIFILGLLVVGIIIFVIIAVISRRRK